MAEAVRVERRQRVEVGIGEAAERDGQDVELAGLDQREEERQRALELGDLDMGRGLRPTALAEADRWRGGDGRIGGRLVEIGRHHRDAGELVVVEHQLASSASWSRRPASDRPGRPGVG